MSEVVEAIPEKAGFLDTVAARLLAVVVACGAGYLLYVSHLHYQGVPSGIMSGVDRAAFNACVDERMQAFEKLAESANYSEQRRAAAIPAARASANVLCAELARPDAAAQAE